MYGQRRKSMLIIILLIGAVNISNHNVGDTIDLKYFELYARKRKKCSISVLLSERTEINIKMYMCVQKKYLRAA